MTNVKTDKAMDTIPQFKLEEPDTPKSTIEVLSRRSYLTLGTSYEVPLVRPSNLSQNNQFVRLNTLFDPHLIIDTPIQGLPTDVGFVVTGSIATNLNGSKQKAAGGFEAQFGLAPVAHIYLQNQALYNLDSETFSWQIEGGARFPALLYEGPLLLGAGFGFGGTIFDDDPAYFTAAINASF